MVERPLLERKVVEVAVALLLSEEMVLPPEMEGTEGMELPLLFLEFLLHTLAAVAGLLNRVTPVPEGLEAVEMELLGQVLVRTVLSTQVVVAVVVLS